MYALANLADDWEQQRQQCVDVLCAYLRLPWDPEHDPRRPAISETVETIPGRRDNTRNITTYGYPNQPGEIEVRRTILRVIADHLRPVDPTRRPPWSELALDLTGATLPDLDFTNTILPTRTTFSAATFSGHAGFDGATFSGHAGFGRVTFSGDAGFAGVTFSDASSIVGHSSLALGRITDCGDPPSIAAARMNVTNRHSSGERPCRDPRHLGHRCTVPGQTQPLDGWHSQAHDSRMRANSWRRASVVAAFAVATTTTGIVVRRGRQPSDIVVEVLHNWLRNA